MAASCTDEDTEAQKGQGPQQGSYSRRGPRTPHVLLLGQGPFPLGHMALPPQQPLVRVTTIWPSRAFSVLVPLCSQGLELRSRKPGEGMQLGVRDRLFPIAYLPVCLSACRKSNTIKQL